MMIRLRNSGRLWFGKPTFIQSLPRWGFQWGLSFCRYREYGIDWRYWRFGLGEYFVMYERPSSGLDGEKLFQKLLQQR